MPEGSTRRGREGVCRILLHIAAKLITLSKKFCYFHLLQIWGENTIKKIRPPQKERKKHKKA